MDRFVIPAAVRGGWPEVTEFPVEARAAYDQALTLHREVDDRGNEAVTLNNIGAVYAGLGDRQQALPIRREVGDRAGEAVTRYNIAMTYRDRGDLARAIVELE